jgi:hypothetical protein
MVKASSALQDREKLTDAILLYRGASHTAADAFIGLDLTKTSPKRQTYSSHDFPSATLMTTAVPPAMGPELGLIETARAGRRKENLMPLFTNSTPLLLNANVAFPATCGGAAHRSRLEV